MKSNDCHVMMQVFLPIALLQLLPKHVRQRIVKLCLFFNKICNKVIDPKELNTLQEDIVETLCKFEMCVLISAIICTYLYHFKLLNDGRC